MSDAESNAVDALAESLGYQWPVLASARRKTSEVCREIQSRLTDDIGRMDSDVDVVVFGSLARGEWTSGSDIDWTLLIDGQANPEHQQLARRVAELLPTIEYQGRPLPQPGRTGVFGSMVFSHDAIHRIGGDADSNTHTTRRILLLLESQALRTNGDSGPRAYERAVNGVIERYLRDDANVSGPQAQARIPRFLLNDIVRYWRTMCVDFAWKGWEQGGEKWAVRNVKLRMSRKLLFASGMLAVFSCQLIDGRDSDAIAAHLLECVRQSPTEIAATVLPSIGLAAEAGELLAIYDRFLAEMDDVDTRKHLASLNAETAYEDDVFLKLRDLSHRFQNVLGEVFFEKRTELREFNKQYGVF